MVPILAVFELFFKIDLIYNFVLISPTVRINSSFHVFENITLSKENEEFYLDCSQRLFIYNIKFYNFEDP